MGRTCTIVLLCLVAFPSTVGAVSPGGVDNESAATNWTLVHQTDAGERWYVDKQGSTFLPGPVLRIQAKQDRGRNYRLFRYEVGCARGVYRMVEFRNHLYDGSLHNALDTPDAEWVSMSPEDTPEGAVLKAACAVKAPGGPTSAVRR